MGVLIQLKKLKRKKDYLYLKKLYSLDQIINFPKTKNTYCFTKLSRGAILLIIFAATGTAVLLAYL